MTCSRRAVLAATIERVQQAPALPGKEALREGLAMRIFIGTIS
jgi:hypothetical protein